MHLRPATLRKYRAIHERFNALHQVQRLRLDDVEAALVSEFFIGRHRLMLILKMELPPCPS